MARRTRLLKEQAIAVFEFTSALTGFTDKPQLAEAWCIYIDGLHRDGRITDYQVNNWTNPYHK